MYKGYNGKRFNLFLTETDGCYSQKIIFCWQKETETFWSSILMKTVAELFTLSRKEKKIEEIFIFISSLYIKWINSL